MMHEYLKVKVKSLAAEARIIRLEERRARAANKRELRLGLADHRRGIVRKAARSTLLAYGFLRGTPYRAMESKCHTQPDWRAVQKMVSRYGHDDGFEEWRKASSPLAIERRDHG